MNQKVAIFLTLHNFCIHQDFKSKVWGKKRKQDKRAFRVEKQISSFPKLAVCNSFLIRLHLNTITRKFQILALSFTVLHVKCIKPTTESVFKPVVDNRCNERRKPVVANFAMSVQIYQYSTWGICGVFSTNASSSNQTFPSFIAK